MLLLMTLVNPKFPLDEVRSLQDFIEGVYGCPTHHIEVPNESRDAQIEASIYYLRREHIEEREAAEEREPTYLIS